MGSKKVMVSGHLCIDLIPDFKGDPTEAKDYFKPGSIVNVGPIKMSTGGAVSNTGIALKKMGVEVLLNSKVGDDELGKIILSALEKYTDMRYIKVSKGESSSYSVVISPPGVDRIFYHNPGTNDTFSSEDVDYDFSKDSSLFHFGYPPLMSLMYRDRGGELVKIFKTVKARGLVTSLDMAYPDPLSDAGRADWKDILKNTLEYVDIFTPSIEEIMHMAFYEKYRELLRDDSGKDFIELITGELLSKVSTTFLKWGVGIVVLKCGHKGIYIRTGSEEILDRISQTIPLEPSSWAKRELWIPAFNCDNIVSTTGAGDCSIAGFIAAFIRGEGIDRALKYAVMAGYQNLQKADAFSGIKDWETTSKMVEDYDMSILDFDPKTIGWVFDDCKNVWVGPNDSAGL